MPGLIKRTLLILFISSCGSFVHADVSLPKLFSDHMVLQRNQPINIWGWATPGEKVTVTFDSKNYETTSNNSGKWSVKMDPLPAGGPYVLEVSGINDISFQGILIGDVWLCSGQSNMQWNLHQTQYQELDTTFVRDAKVRLFTVGIQWDYQPLSDVQSGSWNEMSMDNIQFFSAVGYHFGKFLSQNVDVPIGLINSSLGASSIEAWMSNESLYQFDQFKPDIEPVMEHKMNFQELTDEFENIRADWEESYYLKGPGIDGEWHKPETDVSDWKEIQVPGYWEEFGLADHDGAVWYQKEFNLPDNFEAEQFLIQLNQIDDYDKTWINGHLVGEIYGRHSHRNYNVDAGILKPTNNVIVVRAFDIGGKGGFTTNAFWGNPILVGSWRFKKGLEIDSESFPKVTMPNASPFSSPGVLYNGSIAPLMPYGIKGVIWYQGESNEYRAYEYRELLPAMIQDWRKNWGQGDFPFLIVQLANHRETSLRPQESRWAEIREAQFMALDLPNVGLACAIDIGEAGDIHPKNKEDVGRRLGLSALKIGYGMDVVYSGPVVKSVDFEQEGILITYTNVGGGLVNRSGGDILRGFAVSTEERYFDWGEARIVGRDQVLVSSPHENAPVAVRYGWADNPKFPDLYNSEGLPAVPFRTDEWPGLTYKAVYEYELERF